MTGSDKPIYEFRGPFGVPVQIQPGILLLFLIFLSVSGSPSDLVYDLIFVSLLVLSIFLHEVGHAWGCLIQGIPVRRIVLHAGGGFCEHKRSPSPYENELIVAMGPIVNLVIWALASMTWPLFGNGDLSWCVWVLGYINLFLAVLNLLPVHPLDGGKLFELALMRVLPPQTAHRISGGVGFVIALIWIPAMILCFFTLGLVLFFIPSVRAHWEMMRGEDLRRRT